MGLRLKLVLLTGAPILIALLLMAAIIHQQTYQLVRQEKALVQDAFLASKEAELKHYVELAHSTLMRIAEGPSEVGARKEQALATLKRMQFGDNGYFFAYDQHGQLLMDPKSLAMQGVDFCDPNDPASADLVQRILNTARRGGGVVLYSWSKPNAQSVVPKMAYVMTMPGWNWVIGTGIYLDDVQGALQAIETGARANIEATRERFYAIAAVCVVLIGLGGLALNLKDHRVSSDKLRRLARRVVRSQEDERVRVARELHDGVVQVLASSKLLLETAQLQLADAGRADPPAPRQALDKGLTQLGSALTEIRRVSHGLRPALLDDLGLAPALSLLARQVQESGAFTVELVCQGVPGQLPAEHGTALFRIAQEALQNCRNHAQAGRVELVLHGARHGAGLQVIDDGQGFHTRDVFKDGARGIGLRNMRERAESLGGTLSIHSGRQGTRIAAWLPLLQGERPPPAPAAATSMHEPRPHSLAEPAP